MFVYAYEFEVVAIGVADPIRHANEYGETPPLTATLHVAGTCGSTVVGPASAPIARGLVVDRRGTCIWSNASTSACNTLCERVSSLCETSCTDSVACVHPARLCDASGTMASLGVQPLASRAPISPHQAGSMFVRKSKLSLKNCDDQTTSLQ